MLPYIQLPIGLSKLLTKEVGTFWVLWLLVRGFVEELFVFEEGVFDVWFVQNCDS